MRLIVYLLVAGISYGAETDPHAIVQRAISVELSNYQRLRQFAFQERIKKTDLDKHGAVKKVDVKAFDTTIIEGSAYRRLISRFDKPLSPAEEASEEIKIETSAAERRAETPKQRAERIERDEKTRRQNREAIEEIPNAFDMELLGEERINSRPAWIIALTPRPGYRPASFRARIFTSMTAKLWIDSETYHWVRVEGDLTKTLSFGLFLLRLYKGAQVRIENRRLEEGVWAMDRLWYVAELRIGLIKYAHYEQESLFTGYRRLPVTSGTVPIAADAGRGPR